LVSRALSTSIVNARSQSLQDKLQQLYSKTGGGEGVFEKAHSLIWNMCEQQIYAPPGRSPGAGTTQRRFDLPVGEQTPFCPVDDLDLFTLAPDIDGSSNYWQDEYMDLT
jgi:hypothetical protein